MSRVILPLTLTVALLRCALNPSLLPAGPSAQDVTVAALVVSLDVAGQAR